jgi:diguanylate cyclase (GGDEF)-like protein
MQAPPKPSAERRRLSAIRRLDILDTEPEERFDRFTRLARVLFDVPMAYVSIVDAERQWFKSRAGLPRDLAETKRDISFCGHAILGEEIMIIPDASEDQRFFDNPAVLASPKIRFYMGYPLSSVNGSKIGAFCLVDTKPRLMSEEQTMMLENLGKMVGREVLRQADETIDPGTQISNRKGVAELGAFILSVCRSSNLPATLLVFRLNGLDQIEAKFRHVTTCQALLRFSWFLRGTFRDLDVAGRTGDASFAVLLSDLSPAQSNYALARLEAAIARHNTAETHKYRIRFTVGAIHYDPKRHADIEMLLAEGDAFLAAKPEG